ncbi:TPA: hypothetical protein OT862_000083 [Enterococcus faecalis]|nr:hypothetical protein [Enterococcus faecalis]
MVSILYVLIVLVCFVAPITLTLYNVYFLFKRSHESRFEPAIERWTWSLGIILSLVFVRFMYMFKGDWQEVLINGATHNPIASEEQPVILWLIVIGLTGYFLLKFSKEKRLPPLVMVFAIAGTYIGIFVAAIWIVQLSNHILVVIFLGLPAFNFILLALRTIKEQIVAWQGDHTRVEKTGILAKVLMNSLNWWWLAFIFMLPILGIFLAVLILFGQRPDAMVRAWTETSDWALSQKISPPNVQVDEHYLCTVAACGHRNFVKPQRMGIHHNHQVVVNRQLCVANAFEQILEEKVPKTHRFIRKNYDTYGFPIAKKIHSPYVADLVYLMMKPAEYFFLLVLYLVDIKPENRIALQYITKPKNF